MKKSKVTLPTPIKREERICFGIKWFKTEAEAAAYHAYVREKGVTYNGGFFHGMACGRDKTWDHVDETHGQLYAVTD